MVRLRVYGYSKSLMKFCHTVENIYYRTVGRVILLELGSLSNSTVANIAIYGDVIALGVLNSIIVQLLGNNKECGYEFI